MNMGNKKCKYANNAGKKVRLLCLRMTIPKANICKIKGPGVIPQQNLSAGTI